MNRHVERVLDPSRKDTHWDAGRWRGIDDPLGGVDFKDSLLGANQILRLLFGRQSWVCWSGWF